MSNDTIAFTIQYTCGGVGQLEKRYMNDNNHMIYSSLLDIEPSQYPTHLSWSSVCPDISIPLWVAYVLLWFKSYQFNA